MQKFNGRGVDMAVKEKLGSYYQSFLFLILATSFLAIAILIVGTYAWLESMAINYEIAGEVAELIKIYYVETDEIKVENIGPVLDYSDGVIVDFYIDNPLGKNYLVGLDLQIDEISDNLKSDNFKCLIISL